MFKNKSSFKGSFESYDGKLTREGFLHMHLMEAGDRKNGDQSDLWIMLESMGFNADLILDKVKLTSNVRVDKIVHPGAYYYALFSYYNLFLKTTEKPVVQGRQVVATGQNLFDFLKITKLSPRTMSDF